MSNNWAFTPAVDIAYERWLIDQRWLHGLYTGHGATDLSGQLVTDPSEELFESHFDEFWDRCWVPATVEPWNELAETYRRSIANHRAAGSKDGAAEHQRRCVGAGVDGGRSLWFCPGTSTPAVTTSNVRPYKPTHCRLGFFFGRDGLPKWKQFYTAVGRFEFREASEWSARALEAVGIADEFINGIIREE